MTPKKYFLLLLSINAFLVVCSFFLNLNIYDQANMAKVTNIFDVNSERNIPSVYSTLLLLTCAFTSFKLGNNRKKNSAAEYKAWFCITFIFTFLALDEFFAIHENVGFFVRRFLGEGGFLHYKWVIVYAPITFIVLSILFYSLKGIKKEMLSLIILAGVLFILGALGVETIGGIWAKNAGTANYLFYALTSIEEFLEMTGSSLYIYATTKQYKDNNN